jgi:hypothetical protein
MRKLPLTEVDLPMTTPDRAMNRRPEATRAWKAVLLFVGGFFVIGALFRVGSLRPRTPSVAVPGPGRGSRADYLGSRGCADCHPGEFASHSRSGHAHTLRTAAKSPQARRLSGSTFADPERLGVRWTYSLRDGQFWTERHEAGDVERIPIDYAIGSGHHATTFVTLTDRTPERPTLLEHRLTVFSHSQTPDITPGQGNNRGSTRQGVGSSGRLHSTEATLKCFECHTVATSDRGPHVLDESTMIPNVGCERCHGPGRAHALAARRGAGDQELKLPFGPEPRKAWDELQLCGACHRLPETVDPALISSDSPLLVRFQPVGLMQSACYRKSQGRIACSTCHDPHARTSTDVPAYVAVCLSCHRGPSRISCKISPEAGCIDCHMPRRDASRGMMMTDHWIRSRSGLAPAPRYQEPPHTVESHPDRNIGP